MSEQTEMRIKMKTLVLAEKPSVGRDIGRVLHCTPQGNGFLEGKDYIVTWGLGHLVTLKDPEGYDKKYKEWKMEELPIMPKKLETEVIRQTAKQFQTVKKLVQRQDVKEIVIATDAGREGELVARWILKEARNQKPCRRLWVSSVTDKAIRDGFAHLKNSKEYDPLYRAAVSRAEADWLVGINATRALTCKYNAQLSCGRVQTPTLAMIQARENEIRRFVPESYYRITAKADGITFTWKEGKTGSLRTYQKERAQEIKKECEKHSLIIRKTEKKEKKVYPPLLYDLTELQRDANKRFGLSAKETLNIMQRLYENHKVLTYPRTDSRYLTSDVVGTLSERLDACAVGPYRKMALTVKAQHPETKKWSFVDNKKVSDHHAIIPTEQFVDLTHMTNEERKIYDLVVLRLLSAFCPPCRYEETVIYAESGREQFVARGKVMIDEGFRQVQEMNCEDEDESSRDMKDQTLPKISQGMEFKQVQVDIREGKTTPPPRFTEATLLSAMENPVKYMKTRDADAVRTLGETGGLGTVATRADIIEKLFHSFLMEKKGNEIHITSKARQLLELVPEDLKKPELTADWEMKLSRIASGKLRQEQFIRDIREYTREIVQEIRAGEGQFRHDNLTNKICPNCGKRLLAVNGKNSKMLVCQDRECGYRETISRTTNARCPKCHKRMELYVKGKEETFICTCGYKEKLSSFQSRRQKEGAGISKRDVQNYMRKQKKEAEAPVNNALAEALSGLNLK